MKVPQFMPWVGLEEYQAIADCFTNNWITEGPKAKEFTEQILKFTGAKYGVLAPNGTLAIYLALKSIGVGHGDEVIVPDFTFIGSATAVIMAGATPIFVDVNKENFQIDVSTADRLVGPTTKAIMPVHVYGTVANMDEVMEFSRKYRLSVIEDAAQAFGVHFKGQHSGTFGEVGAFSFFADKTVTTAEGGFVVTNNPTIFDKLLYLRNQGRKNRGTFIHPEIGYNFRITDIQCAVGLVQLNKLNSIKEKKIQISNMYKDALRDIDAIKFLQPEAGAESIPFRVGLICRNVRKLSDFLHRHQIEPRSFFYPLHSQPAFRKIVLSTNQDSNRLFPNSIYAFEHGMCLPTYPSMDESQIQYVCDTIKKFYT